MARRTGVSTRNSSTATIGKTMKKAERDRIMAGVKMPEFHPLRSWPKAPHPTRQAELEAFADRAHGPAI